MALGGGRSYDLNSWRGERAPGNNATAQSVAAYHDRVHAASGAPPGELWLEGYGPTGARYLQHFKRRGVKGGGGGSSSSSSGSAGGAGSGASRTVWLDDEPGGDAAEGTAAVARLDAVGGAMLLVHAELHRHGLVFPPYPHRHRIETEGLSMAALDMGVLSWGLPFLEVLHA